MIWIRSLLALLVPSLTGITLLLVCAPFGRRRALALTLPTVSWLGLRLVGIRTRVGGDLEALNIRPAVFVINHQSGLDPLLVASVLKRDLVAVAKAQLRHHPLLGPLLWLAGTLFVEPRAHAGPQALAPLLPALAQGYAVALAPEGKRRHDGNLGPFRPGALWLAQQAQVPVVAIVLHNSGDMLAPGGLTMRPGCVDITVMPPANAEMLDADKLARAFRQRLDAGPAQPGGTGA